MNGSFIIIKKNLSPYSHRHFDILHVALRVTKNKKKTKNTAVRLMHYYEFEPFRFERKMIYYLFTKWRCRLLFLCLFFRLLFGFVIKMIGTTNNVIGRTKLNRTEPIFNRRPFENLYSLWVRACVCVCKCAENMRANIITKLCILKQEKEVIANE